MSELRERKKRETRERISDVATRLFVERGFDAVTMEEIAAAAVVSTVTISNYFGRKEDLFFDRGSEDYERVREALTRRETGVGPVRALRALVHELIVEQSPFVVFDDTIVNFWRTAKESPALRARAHELRADFQRALTAMLEEQAARRDGAAPMVAGMLVAAWCVAFSAGLRARRAGATAKAAQGRFRKTLDEAFDAVERGFAGSSLV